MTQNARQIGSSVFWISSIYSSHLLLLFPSFHVLCSPSRLCGKLLSQRLLSGTISLYRLYMLMKNLLSPHSILRHHIFPEGFSEIESSDEFNSLYYSQFKNPSNDWFHILVLPIESTQKMSLDSEFSTYYSVNFNGIQAIWGIMDDKSNTLLWESGTLSFQVRGNLDLTEIIKISEGIKVE